MRKEDGGVNMGEKESGTDRVGKAERKERREGRGWMRWEGRGWMGGKGEDG